MVDFDERDIENVNFNNKSRSGSARKRRDSYDYMNTVQMLGRCLLHVKMQQLDPIVMLDNELTIYQLISTKL